MSQERLEKLEALLTRVQANRKTTRTIAGMPSPIMSAMSAMSAPASARTSPGTGWQEPAKPMRSGPPIPQPRPAALNVPPRAGLPGAHAAPAPHDAVASRPEAIAAKSHSDVHAAPRQSTPPPPPPEAVNRTRTEGSVAGAAPRPPEVAAREVQVSAVGLPAPAPLAGSREAPGPAAAPARPAAAPVAPVAKTPDAELELSTEPHVIEPEPMREPARPIAQVVSRHAPQADATFGAMLKRSLSLRPH